MNQSNVWKVVVGIAVLAFSLWIIQGRNDVEVPVREDFEQQKPGAIEPSETERQRADNRAALVREVAAQYAQTIRVEFSDGTLAIGVRGVVFDDEGLFEQSVEPSGSSGVIRFSNQVGPAQRLALRVPGAQLFVRVRPESAEASVIVGEGGLFSGQVMVDGQPAPPGVPLQVLGSAPVEGDFPDRVLQALRVDPHRSSLVETTTKEGGIFLVQGLPETWSGSIAVASLDYFHEDQAPEIFDQYWESVPALTQSFVLRLKRTFAIRGTVVNSDYSPVRGGQVVVKCLGKRISITSHSEIADDGTFSAPVRTLDQLVLRSLRIEAVASECSPYSWDEVPLPPDGDLGELVLPPGKTVAVRALSPSGAVLESAVVRVARPSETGDSGGGRWDSELKATVFRVPLDESAILVWAPGFTEGRLELGGMEIDGDVELHSLILELASSLSIALVGDSEEYQAERWTVNISIPMQTFSELRGGWLLRVLPSAGTFLGFRSLRRERRFAWRFRPDAEGKLEVTGFPYGAEVWISVIPRNGPAVVANDVVVVPSVGSAQREYLLNEDWAILRGKVVDEDGLGLCPDSLSIFVRRGEEGIWMHDPASVNEIGEFSVEYVAGEPFSLIAKKRGYAPTELADLGKDRLEEVVNVVLEKTEPVWVYLQDENGDPIRGGIDAAWPGGYSPGVFVELGKYRLEGIPLTPFSLSGAVAGVPFKEASTLSRSVVLTFPVPGKVQALWVPPEDVDQDGLNYWIRLLPLNPDHRPLTLRTDTSGQVIGPVAAGAYRAQLCTSRPGVRVQPIDQVFVDIEVQSGSVSIIDFAR
jgi:hypothetical protein